MPNASTSQRGPCQTCDAYGGAADSSGATICKRPQDSRKKVCRMPEAGCMFWRPVKLPPKPLRPPEEFMDPDRENFRARR